jgi:ChrR-like protein with cupin domain
MTDRNDPSNDAAPRLTFVHIDDVAAQEVVAQMHGEQRVGVHLKFLEWTPSRMVAYTRYDPGLILERHGHSSDAVIFIIDGHLTVGDRECPPGTLIVLERGAVFGPLVAGADGCTFLECYGDDVTPVPADKDGYYRLLAERGIERLPNPVFEAPPGAPAIDRGEGDNWS